MKHDNSTKSWSRLGEEWIGLVQSGGDGKTFIMPYTLNKLGDVTGKIILDLGCGEGSYAREFAKAGAKVTAVDCSEQVITYAIKRAKDMKLDIEHYVRNSNDLYDIEPEKFDIVLCSMMLMDCEDFHGTIKEIARVLKKGGLLFASVLHPCFSGEHNEGIFTKGSGVNREIVVRNYFEPRQWEAPLNRGTIPVLWHHRTLEEYVKTFLKCGLKIIDLNEPMPTEEQAENSVQMKWLRKIPFYLFWELTK